ncbi:MAG TPA: sulfotransferase domain-containing protein [Terriglobales bacterium]|nr:sulfotransferase domain-containing protein [Terriglobales bacterium]
MIYGVKRVIKYVLGTDVAGRGLAVYSDDTFIVSYPRSGNTWTRFLVANLVYAGQPVTFANIERLIPDCEAQSNRYLKRVARPRIIKSHEYFDPRYKKAIYIVRDPRDVALSYYNFSRKYRQIEDSYPLERYIGDFVDGRLTSADWGTWGENVGTWVAARKGRPTFLLLRYEDLIADTQTELAKVARFFGVDASPGELRRAIENSSADHLRELEKKEGSEWITTKNKRPDIPFIGSAVAGKWKSVLPDAAVEEIESAWGNLMAQLGYELVTRKAESAETQLAATAVLGEQPE